MSIERFLAMPFQQIPVLGGGRLICLENIYGSGDIWPNLQTANHNVFLLDANSKMVWQVIREEKNHMNWEILHKIAKEKDPTCEGYFDPFWNLGLDERTAASPEPAGVYRPGCKVYLTTRWWLYELDVETGIATCTGDQVK